MLFRQMKYFAAVVECSSFTEAAERCYISQSAISQQIRSLEKELGVDLILNDQRRAFSDVYVNFELMQCGCLCGTVYTESFKQKEENPVGGTAAAPLHPDFLPGTAECRAGVLPEYPGIRRQLSVCR